MNKQMVVYNQLSLPQFLAKHKLKFDRLGLTRAERAARYNGYLGNPETPSRNNPNPRSRRPNLIDESNTALKMQNLRATGRSIRAKAPVYRPPPQQFGGPGAKFSPNRFSDCAFYYAQALIDPWNVERAPCVPDAITVPSFKFGARTRGTMTVGSAGVGYVVNSPYEVSGDLNSTCYTSTGYTYYYYAGAGAGITGAGYATSDSPIVSSAFNSNGNAYRVVGSGLAIRYLGNEMARGGQILLYRTNDNVSPPTGGGSVSTYFFENKETTSVPVDREWHYVLWKPVLNQDTFYNGTLPGATSYCMLAFVSGAGAGTAFEFDIVTWYEITGPDLPNLTPSENDPIGMAVVKSAIAVPQPADAPAENFSRFLRTASDIASHTLSFIGTGVSAVVKGAALLSNVGLL